MQVDDTLISSRLQAHEAHQPYLQLAAIQLENLQVLPALEISWQGRQGVETANKQQAVRTFVYKRLALMKHATHAIRAPGLEKQDNRFLAD